MRTSHWVAGAVLALGLVPSAFAQQKDPTTFFGGVAPKDLVYRPVDTSHVVAPVGTPSKITLGGIMSKFNIPGLKIMTPKPTLPAKGFFPGSPYKNAFEPQMPIAARH